MSDTLQGDPLDADVTPYDSTVSVGIVDGGVVPPYLDSLNEAQRAAVLLKREMLHDATTCKFGLHRFPTPCFAECRACASELLLRDAGVGAGAADGWHAHETALVGEDGKKLGPRARRRRRSSVVMELPPEMAC